MNPNNFFGRLFEAGWIHNPWHVIGITWLAWVASWFIAALWNRQTAARPRFVDELLYRIVTGMGASFLFGLARIPALDTPWPVTDAFAWLMAVCVVGGFAFCWWARLHLGSLWSGNVTRKENHRIVETGPYALVRHPIYTGIIVSAFATAFAIARVESVIGACLITLGCWIKARLEERFLSQSLGEDYAAYRGRVKMLVPYLA